MPKSDLPFGSEFSPSQIDLPTLLELASRHEGDWHQFEDAVRQTYFDSHVTTSDYNRRKLANNTRLSMIAYGIYDRQTHSLTDFGRVLYDLRQDEPALYEELARHILLRLNGTALLQCLEDMRKGGEKVSLTALRSWLGERGVVFPRGGKHPSMMKLWLERAGVLKGWVIQEARLSQVLGTSLVEIERLASLTKAQQAYLKALANLGGEGPFSSNEVEKLASATYGAVFNEKSVSTQVLHPLEKLGYIRLERGTRESGRGAKPFNVFVTEKLRSELVEPLLQQLERGVGPDLRPLLRKPISSILLELRAQDRHTRGLALEALAFKLMRLIDLNYVFTRLRGDATGGAEVDLVFESSRLVFSRWQVQCKNSAKVALDSLAKEVGLVHMLKSNVIVLVTTGTIGPDARRYGDMVMKGSNLAIVLIDGEDLKEIESKPANIVDVLHREAKMAMQIKRLELHAD